MWLRKLLFLNSVCVTIVVSLNDPYDMRSEFHGVIVGVVVRTFVPYLCISCQGTPRILGTRGALV